MELASPLPSGEVELRSNSGEGSRPIERAQPLTRSQKPVTSPCGRGEKSLARLPRRAQQEHALLAEHVPEPPGRAEPQRAAVEVERHRALHLDIDLVAELHEVLDGAEMDVRRVVPGRGQ